MLPDDERREQHEQTTPTPHQLALVARAPGPEVQQDQPDAVERVEHDRPDQAELEQPDDRVLVGAHDLVVRLRRDPHERGVRTCTKRKKKIPTPVIRCATQDHMPSRPRYSVPRRCIPGGHLLNGTPWRSFPRCVHGRRAPAAERSQPPSGRRRGWQAASEAVPHWTVSSPLSTVVRLRRAGHGGVSGRARGRVRRPGVVAFAACGVAWSPWPSARPNVSSPTATPVNASSAGAAWGWSGVPGTSCSAATSPSRRSSSRRR